MQVSCPFFAFILASRFLPLSSILTGSSPHPSFHHLSSHHLPLALSLLHARLLPSTASVALAPHSPPIPSTPLSFRPSLGSPSPTPHLAPPHVSCIPTSLTPAPEPARLFSSLHLPSHPSFSALHYLSPRFSLTILTHVSCLTAALSEALSSLPLPALLSLSPLFPPHPPFPPSLSPRSLLPRPLLTSSHPRSSLSLFSPHQRYR
ncbi:hypothetical protein B0H12DRAFT_1102863 [Mycena haematopus]|nr:hypothetical protein B0H12DRAFT_1102863 [Mycena haematopus]